MNKTTKKISKSVCVVGAGLSGLCTIKELMEQGHTVTCYELSSDFGGAFSSKGKASLMYEHMQLTVSNYFMAYSSMPPKANEKRKYWNAKEYYQYLTDYVEKFSLLEYIIFNTIVTNVERHLQGYRVTLSNGDVREFDAIVLCTGTNRIPNIPNFNGVENFKGEIIHTSTFKGVNDLEDKRVVCIGVGESGVDVANEVAKNSKQCTIIARRLPSVVPRYINNHTGDAFTSKAFNWLSPRGVDIFMKLKAKFYLTFHPWISEKNRLHFQWILNNGSFFNRFLTKNDDFLNRIVDKSLNFVCSEVKTFDENSVVLENGQKIEADVIILNTGYAEDFKAVSSFIKVENVRKFYKHMISPDLGESFALIGWARPTQGGVPLCSELQARYLALLLAGERQLPEMEKLKSFIEQDEAYEESIFKGSQQIKGLVNYHQFVGALAKLIGCAPMCFLFMKPKLSYKMWFGSHLPLFYRLYGPGASPDLAESIIKSLPTGSSLRRNLMLSIVGVLSQLGKKVKRV